MGKRGRIAIGMAGGLVWSLGVLWIGGGAVTLPVFTLMPMIMTAFLAPGIVLLLIIARLAQRRFFDDEIIDGAPFVPGSGAQIDQRVLTNTVEQMALAIWPAAAVMLGGKGPGVILCLGLGFAVARLAFWIGYHLAPPLRAFGFAASFYPTVLVALWALVTVAGLGG